MVALAFYLSLFLILSALTLQFMSRKIRDRRFAGLTLTPNCLLTRHPILFLNGPRSLFHFINHWNDVPRYLREHGYEVFTFDMRFNRHLKSFDSTELHAALDAMQIKCHVIGDSSIAAAIYEIASFNHLNVASLTLIQNPHRSNQSGIAALLAKSQKNHRPLVNELKPTATAVEIFQLPTLRPNTLAWPIIFNHLARLRLRLHNLLIPTPGVDPIETAYDIDRASWTIESQFLTLAVQLAERDLIYRDSASHKGAD